MELILFFAERRLRYPTGFSQFGHVIVRKKSARQSVMLHFGPVPVDLLKRYEVEWRIVAVGE